MTNRINIIFTALLFIGICSGELFAVGTPAGTVIQSRSRVTFASRTGAYIDTAYSAVLTLTIAQKGAVNITPSSNAFTTLSDSTNVDYAVNIINSGNGTDAAKLTAVSSRGWITQLYRDVNGDGVLQPNEFSAGTITQTPSMSADAFSSIIIRVKVPRNESLNGVKDTSIVSVRSLFDTIGVNTGTYVTTVRTTGIDPANPGLSVNNPSPSAGQQVTYTLTITNNGSVPAQGVTISDLFPNGFTYISGSASVGSVNGSSNPVVWTIGTIAPSQSVTVSVTLQINNGVLPGTILSNHFSVNYTSGNNSYSVLTNSVPVTVTGVLEYGLHIAAFTSAVVKEYGDTVIYRFSVKNTGSFKDVIEISSASSQGLTWKIFRDGDKNGSWGTNDPLLTNTNDSAGVDLDSVAVGDSVRIFALSTIPNKGTDQLKDTLRLIAASSGDHSKSAEASVVTTMNIPLVILNKTVFPAGNHPAGAVISYLLTYSNTGSVAVSNFAVVDTAPEVTEYVKNSVKVNGTGIQDNSGAVSISTDQSNRTVVSVSVGTLSAQSSGTVEFKVKIK